MGRVRGEREARRNRGYAPTLVLGLLCSAAAAVGTARPWASATVSPTGLPTIHATVTGTDLEPACGALGLAMLAAFGAVLATRGRLRRGIGAAIVVGAVVVLVLSVLLPADTHAALAAELSARGWTGGTFESRTEPWRWVVLVAAAGCAATGMAVMWCGARWATMGSRYDAPTASGDPAAQTQSADEMTEPDLWKAIDAGRDPTQTG